MTGFESACRLSVAAAAGSAIAADAAVLAAYGTVARRRASARARLRAADDQLWWPDDLTAARIAVRTGSDADESYPVKRPARARR